MFRYKKLTKIKKFCFILISKRKKENIKQLNIKCLSKKTLLENTVYSKK